MDNKDWIPIAKAVIVTELTDRTLRRWIVKGKLPSRKKSGKVYVNLSGLGYDLSDIDNEPVQTIDDKVTIARLEAEVSGMARDINRMQDEIEYLRRLSAEMISKIPAIEATAGERKSRSWKFWQW